MLFKILNCAPRRMVLGTSVACEVSPSLARQNDLAHYNPEIFWVVTNQA